MMIQMAYPHIEKPPDAPARLKRIPRLRVAQIVMDHLAHGWSIEEICRQHPNLAPAEAYAAMGYYFDHQSEIDAEIRAEWDQIEREHSDGGASGRRSPFYIRARAKGLT